MRNKSIMLSLAVLVVSILGCSKSMKLETPVQSQEPMAVKAAAAPKYYEGIEFQMKVIAEPSIPNNTVNIKDFGAVSGGKVLNTQAIADAIASVSSKGGGKVIIPAGIWLTGPIILKSNIELYTETGALVRFSPDKDLYPVIATSFEGLNTYRCLSPIYGKDIHDVAFTGNGVWDGTGEVWRQVKKSKLTEGQWKKLVASGGVLNDKGDQWYPSEQFKSGANGASLNVRLDLNTKAEFVAIRDFLRPVMLSIQNSKRVMLDGPTFQNSPAWCLHPLMVEDLIVRNITVRNPWFSQNGDGIDVESCKNVLIENSRFDVGDDAICIKAGKDKDGRDRAFPCENLIIRNNVVYHGHGGVTVGSEMSSGVNNMHVSNCLFMGTDVGLRFKSKRGRGGVVQNIFISDVRMTDIPTNAISFNLYYGGLSVSEMLAQGTSGNKEEVVPVNEETPQFKDIVIKDIVVNGARQAVFLQGLPEMNLENVIIDNLLAETENGFSIIDADGVEISNVDLYTESDLAVDIYNSKNVKLTNVNFNSTSKEAVRINGKRCDKVELNSSQQMDFTKNTIIGKDVMKDAVSL